MNKAFELEHLRNLLMNPELPSGLYLLDTDLTDEEIEEYIIELGCCSYMKESLFPPSKGGYAFELLGSSDIWSDAAVMQGIEP